MFSKVLLAAALVALNVAPAMCGEKGKSWSGLYFGASAGYGFGSNVQTGSWIYPVSPPAGKGSFDFSNFSRGVLGGGQVGWNYQLDAKTVVGLEADLQAANILSSSNGTGTGAAVNGFAQTVTVSGEERIGWFGTVRGRVGFLPSESDLLVYAAGGLAYGEVKSSVTLVSRFPTFPAVATGSDSFTAGRVGWTVGAGLEYAISERWRLKSEYLFTDLGSVSFSGSASQQTGVGALFNYSRSATVRFHTVRVGLNYAF